MIVEPLKNFFPAEDYHQKYLEKNPCGYCHIPESYFTLNEKKGANGSKSDLSRSDEEK